MEAGDTLLMVLVGVFGLPLAGPPLTRPPPRYPSLVRCCLGERSAGALGAALASTCCLEQLDLSWNNLGVRGVLGTALASTCCLEQLDLSWNNLGVRGVLGTALASTCCLEQLDLSWNNLGVRGQGQGDKGLRSQKMGGSKKGVVSLWMNYKQRI